MTTVSVAQFLATGAALDAAGSFVVKDSAANLSSALTLLAADAHVVSLVDSDSGPLSLSVGQRLTSSRALGVLSTAGGGKASLKIVDTAANLSHGFTVLFGDLNIKSLIISDNAALALPSPQFYEALSPGLYGHLLSIANAAGGAAHVTPLSTTTVSALWTSEAKRAATPSMVFDTTANVLANLSRLNADSAVTSIGLSDSVPLSLTAVQVQANLHALSEIVNLGLVVSVADTAANISADLNALQSLSASPSVTSITVTITDSAALNLTAAQFAADTNVIAALANRNGASYQINLADTAANLAAIAPSLAGNAHLGVLHVTDSNPLIVSGATWTATGEQAALAKIAGAHAVEIAWGAAKPQDTELLTYDSQGHLLTDAVFNLARWPQTVSVSQSGETLTAGAGARPTTWLLGGTSESFVLHLGFGKDVVTGYVPGADSFTLDRGEFTALGQVASFASLLSHAASDGHGDVVITLGATDCLTLNGVTLAQLQAHSSDWHFI